MQKTIGIVNRSTLLDDFARKQDVREGAVAGHVHAMLNAIAEAATIHFNDRVASAWHLPLVRFVAMDDATILVGDETIVSCLVDDDSASFKESDLSPVCTRVRPILDAGGGVLEPGTARGSVAMAWGHQIADYLIRGAMMAIHTDHLLWKSVVAPVLSSIITTSTLDGTAVDMPDVVYPDYFKTSAVITSINPACFSRQLVAPFEWGPNAHRAIHDIARKCTDHVWGANVPEWYRSERVARTQHHVDLALARHADLAKPDSAG